MGRVECRTPGPSDESPPYPASLNFFGPETPVSEIEVERIEEYRKWRLKRISLATVNIRTLFLPRIRSPYPDR